ncbi:hypothetical protein OJ996_23285 [Luteolibacter sp. GHJ8]|uniref:Uncharacterized protein n=1 Tax=Luteolibacter rhizosphaerae TaxID=2989719 RepID=A0ABT3G9Q5_9BACT|nr:hypothetical protein [Luteolibacter rhizosphaerae]MCW1916530.1 hypothetical protein [Luteolibacter rhizosphaerae]
MRFTTIAIPLVLGLALASCGESTAQRARRLKLDAARIQNETTRAIVMEDLKFMVDLDEREQFFARLRKDMDRCKIITDELRTIDPGADLADLEKNTKLILLRIRIDEEQNNSRRRISESRRDSPRSGEVRSTLNESIAQIEREIELIEEAGEDASGAKKFLEELKKQKAAEDSNAEDAKGMESGGKSGEMAPTESEQVPR